MWRQATKSTLCVEDLEGFFTAHRRWNGGGTGWVALMVPLGWSLVRRRDVGSGEVESEDDGGIVGRE